MKAGRCCAIWASRSGRTEKEETHGQNSASSQAGSQTEVSGTRIHPMPAVRQAQSGLSQVRPLPDLPARNGAPWRATRHHEVVVVMMIGLRRSSALTPGQPPGLRRVRPGARPIHVRKSAPTSDEGLLTSRLADAGISRPQEDHNGAGPVTETAPRRKHSNS